MQVNKKNKRETEYKKLSKKKEEIQMAHKYMKR